MSSRPSTSLVAEFVATAFEYMLFCRTHVDETNNDPSPSVPPPEQPTLHLSEFEELSISPTPTVEDSALCPAHYLSPLPHVVVQPPPNLKGAQSARVLTHAFSISDHPSPASLTVCFVSDGIRTVTTGPMPTQSSNGPGRSLRVHAPPRYSRNGTTNVRAETAEPPTYEGEALPDYSDDAMSVPSYYSREPTPTQ